VRRGSESIVQFSMLIRGPGLASKSAAGRRSRRTGRTTAGVSCFGTGCLSSSGARTTRTLLS
jgi:hypothetical protein